MAAPPPAAPRSPSVTAKPPRRRALGGWIFTGLVAVGCFIYFTRLHVSVPTSGLAANGESTVAVTTPASGQAADAYAPSRFAPQTSATLGRCWVETDVVDFDGYVGVRVHGSIYTAGESGLRFAVHFRDLNGSPVRGVDARYRDANGEASVVVTAPATRDSADVTAFIPASALAISGDAQLQLLPGLFDSSNTLLVKGEPVAFAFHSGKMQITRIRVEESREWQNGAAAHLLKVNLRVLNSQPAMDAVIVARFKDSRGLPLPGHPPYANAAGELTVISRIKIPPSWGDESITDLPVNIPPSLIPNGCTSEVAVYDAQAGTYLTQAVAVPLPFFP